MKAISLMQEKAKKTVHFTSDSSPLEHIIMLLMLSQWIITSVPSIISSGAQGLLLVASTPTVLKQQINNEELYRSQK